MKLLKQNIAITKGAKVEKNEVLLPVIKKLPSFLTVILLITFATIMSCKKDKPIEESLYFTKQYGGSKNDFFSAIAKSQDGGYVFSGYSNSTDGDVTGNKGGNDIWIFKIDKSGNKVWQKTLGGSGDEDGRSIIATPDGGYMVAGVTASTDGDVTGNHGKEDIWLIKLSSDGEVSWQKTLGGSGDDGVGVSSIVATPDGGYFIAGGTGSNDGDVTGNHGDKDAWLVKVNSTGNIIWQKTIGGSGYEGMYSMAVTADGNYVLTGQTSSSEDVTNKGGNDAWIVKVSTTGNILWQKTYGGSGEDNGFLMINTPDGGYLMTGYTTSSDGDVTNFHGGPLDAWEVKIDAMGNMMWQKTLGGTGIELGFTVTNAQDGGYLVGAFSNSQDGDVKGSHGGFEAWLVKLNGSGNIVDQRTMGSTGDDNIVAILPTTNGYIIGGNTTSSDGEMPGNHGANDAYIKTIKNF